MPDKIPWKHKEIPIIINKSVNGIILSRIRGQKVCIVDNVDRLRWTKNFIPPTEKL